MNWYNKAIQAIMKGQADLSTGVYEMLFLSNDYTPDLSDTGHGTETDLGANILHRQVVTINLVNRTLDLEPFQLEDPGGGGVAGHVVLIRQGGSGASSNLLIGHEDIQDLTFDGAADQINDQAAGLLRIGDA